MSDTTTIPFSTIRAQLISLAAQMARLRNMPSTFREDYPKMGAATWQRVSEDAEHATDQAKEWARELKRLADLMPTDEAFLALREENNALKYRLMLLEQQERERKAREQTEHMRDTTWKTLTT